MDERKGPLERAEEHIKEYRQDAADTAIPIETRLSKWPGKTADKRGRYGYYRRNGRRTGDQHFRGGKAIVERYPTLDLFTSV